MKLIIDIPEEIRVTITRMGLLRIPDEMQKKVDRAIQNGTPLPICKNCKYFEYDSVAKVDGIPLIVAHEICSKWGDGCKTKEDGYCFLAERKGEE